MIVVVILGILTAIAAPLFGNVTSNAAETACEATIATIQDAFEMYVLEDSVDKVTALNTTYDHAWILANLDDYVAQIETCSVSGHSGEYQIVNGIVSHAP